MAASSLAGGDPDPGWDAASSLQQVVHSRAWQWRTAEGLDRDEDFAYAFTDFDHAVGIAGHHVADAWLNVRESVEEGLLHATAKVAEGPSMGPTFVRAPKRTIFKRKGHTQPTGPALDSATKKRVNTLVNMFMAMGRFKPAGILTNKMRDDWKAACTRLSQTRWPGPRGPPLTRPPIRGWSSKPSWRPRERAAHRPFWPLTTSCRKAPKLPVALSKLCRGSASMLGSSWSLLTCSCLSAPGWLVRVKAKRRALAGADLGGKSGGTFQGWGRAMVSAFGEICPPHSEPRKLTLAFLHGHCNKGKQQQLRGGFDFAIPANFRTGFPGTTYAGYLEKAASVESKHRTSGYCFNAKGKPWAIKEVQDVMQAGLATVVDNATEMSTYSWRRTGPTFAQLLQMKPEELRWPLRETGRLSPISHM